MSDNFKIVANSQSTPLVMTMMMTMMMMIQFVMVMILMIIMMIRMIALAKPNRGTRSDPLNRVATRQK